MKAKLQKCISFSHLDTQKKKSLSKRFSGTKTIQIDDLIKQNSNTLKQSLNLADEYQLNTLKDQKNVYQTENH